MTADVTPFLNHVTSEHGDKPLFSQMVSATVQPFADMIELFRNMPALYSLDTAVGTQLDTVGKWVGASRDLSAPITGVYFALDTAGVGFDQGVWKGPYDPDSGLVTLPDDFFRLVVRAKIMNNVWNGNKDTAYALASTLFSPTGYTYYIEDNADLSINIGILGSTPTPPLLIALLTSGKLDLKGVTIRVASRVAQQGPVFSFDLDTLLFKGFDQSFWAISL